MPSVSLDTTFCTISLEKFEEFVNRRWIDNTIKEQTTIYKTLHRKLKIEQHEPLKTGGLRCSRKVISSYCIAACEILRSPSEIYRQYTYIVDKYIIYFYEPQKQEKSGVQRAFLPVSQRFQINVIFTDNVRILCLSCKVKKSKTTANLPENIRKSVTLIGYHGVNYHDRTYTGTVSFLVSSRMQQTLSSQCNMTAQIDPVQDNNRYFTQ